MTEPMSPDLLELQLELRHKKPWHFADGDSIWVVTGTYPEGSKYGPGGFRDCIARVVPSFVTGTYAPIFEILLYGDEKHLVTAVDITAAYELLIDAALERRDENRG